MWEDNAFKMYSLLVAASLFDSLLFLGWAIYIKATECRKMSSVFWAITALFFTIFYVSALNLHVRHVMFVDIEHYLYMLKTDMWAFRNAPLVAVLAGIGFFMARRWWMTVFFGTRYNRQTKGRRESDVDE